MANALQLKSNSPLTNFSPSMNQRDSFSPVSSLNTLSPESSNSISSPDKSFLLNQTINDEKQQTFRLIDYFVVTGLEKSSPVEPSAEFSSKLHIETFSSLLQFDFNSRRTNFESISMYISLSSFGTFSP